MRQSGLWRTSGACNDFCTLPLKITVGKCVSVIDVVGGGCLEVWICHSPKAVLIMLPGDRASRLIHAQICPLKCKDSGEPPEISTGLADLYYSF